MPKEKKEKRITPVTVEILPSQDLHKVPTDIATEREVEKPVEVQPPHTPEPPKPKEVSHIGIGFFFIIVMVALFVALFTGALYVYFTGVSQLTRPEATPIASLAPVAVPTAMPTTVPLASTKPAATPKVADYKISILNGSGKIGEAGKVKAMLEKAGFKVTQTGNANSFDYTDTVIQVKSTVPSEVMTKLKDAIKPNYSLKDGEALDSKNSFDIIITVGSK